MFTVRFWKKASEKALTTGALSLLNIWAIGDGVLNVWEINLKDAIGIFLGGVALGYLTSIATRNIGADKTSPDITK